MTASASAIWGTRSGRAKLTVSTRRMPASTRRSTSSIFVCVESIDRLALQPVARGDVHDLDKPAHDERFLR